MKITQLGGLIFITTFFVLIGGCLEGFIQEEQPPTGGILTPEPEYEWVEIGSYEDPLNSQEEAEEVSQKWVEENIISHLMVVKEQLMSETLQDIDQRNLSGRPVFFRAAKSHPLTEEEIKPLDNAITHIKQNLEIHQQGKDQTVNGFIYSVEIPTIHEHALYVENKRISFPRGADVWLIGCEDGVNIERKSPECFPQHLILREGKILKRNLVKWG